MKIFLDSKRKLSIITIYTLYSINQKPKSGYEIIKEIANKTNGKLKPSKGTIYPLLKNLEKNRLIKSEKKQERNKVIFKITKKGKKFLREILKIKNKYRERIELYKNLFSEILDEEHIDAIEIIIEIKNLAMEIENKKRVKKILNEALTKLKNLKNLKIKEKKKHKKR